MPVFEEELSIMKETCTSLVEELNCNTHDTMSASVQRPITVQDSTSSSCGLGELPLSDMTGKENEELVDFEEGEISDSDSIKKCDEVCRFFKGGSCFYGSNCQFLHISNKAYNMFDPISSDKRSLEIVEPCYSASEIKNPLNLMQENSNAWEKGLENAKAMIQKAICKRIDDKEFETKKMYISLKSSSLSIPDKCPIIRSEEKDKLNAYLNDRPHNVISLEHDEIMRERHMYKSSYHDAEKSKNEHKWLDPWMRSRSPRKRKNYKPSSRKDYARELSSSSSSSSVVITYQGSVDKKKSPAHRLSIRRCRSRSYSRSISRSASRSCSSQRSWSRSSSRSSSVSYCSNYSKTKNKSTSNKVPYAVRRIPKKRRSTSLEKWYRSRDKNKPAYKSASRSNLILVHQSTEGISSYNPGKESAGSMTVLSCSPSSPHSPKSQSNHSKSVKKNEPSKTELPNSSQKKESHVNHVRLSASKESAQCKISSRKVSTTLSADNSSPCGVKKDPVSQYVEPVPKLLLEPPSGERNAEDHLSSATSTLLKYRSLSNCFNSHQAAVSKSNSCIATSISSSEALESSKSSHKPDNKEASVCLPKRTITLNLQPKSQKLLKLTAYKNRDPLLTMCKSEEMALNKRNVLLKQLKLVEDAIAKKKRF